MSSYQLAQINIAHAVADLDSATMQGFVDRLDEINALADRSAGFVWRLNPDDDDPNYVSGYDDPRIIVNVSVWQNIDSLKHYVYRSTHIELIKNRAAWFRPLPGSSLALWWVPAGDQPTELEGRSRLERLNTNGASKEAFPFSQPFGPPD